MLHAAHIAALAPVIALALWTHVMGLWMVATRVPAIRAARMRLDPSAPRGAQMATLPARVRWKADNYNHLMEAPTVFYAVALVLAWVEPTPVHCALAWSYVGVRVVHSVWQAMINHIPTRFMLFVLSNVILMVMTVRAAIAVF